MKILVDEDGNIINFNNVTSVYCGGASCNVRCDFIGGSGTCLARYKTNQQCKLAIKIILNLLEKAETYLKVPTIKELEIYERTANVERHNEQHTSTGKVIKRRGGS